MAEKEVGNPFERFPYLKNTVYGFFFDDVKGISYTDLPQVKDILRNITSRIWQENPKLSTEFGVATTEIRESSTDTRIFDTFAYLGVSDMDDKLGVLSLHQNRALLCVKDDNSENGWLTHGQLQSSERDLDPASGELQGQKSEGQLLSTTALQKQFRRHIEEAISELSDVTEEIEMLKEAPDLRKHFSVDLEVTSDKIASLTKPPHHLILRLIPVIQTSHRKFLLTHVNNNPYPSYTTPSGDKQPPPDTVFTVTVMEEEEMQLREDEDEGTSAVKCLQTFCCLQANHPELRGSLLFPYLILNCVLLVKKRKDTDGDLVWPTLFRGEEFVEVMKLLVEYLMLGRLPWHYDPEVSIMAKTTTDTEAQQTEDRKHIVAYLTPIFIKKDYRELTGTVSRILWKKYEEHKLKLPWKSVDK